MNIRTYLVAGLLLWMAISLATAQRYDRHRPLSPKEQILMKLDSIDLLYMSRLRSRDHFEARKRLDAIAQLVDGVLDDVRNREISISEREKALDNRERALEERERDREHFKDRDRNRDRDRDRDEVRISPIGMPEFEQLMSAVEKSPFDQDKKKIIKTSAMNNYFLVDQVIKLASKFAFDKDKLDMVESLYPKILDLDKNYLLYNCFTFSDSKDKLEKFIDQNSPRRDLK